MNRIENFGPLGLLSEINANDKTNEKLLFLENFSLERVKSILITKNKVKIDDFLIDTLEREFKRFFSLRLLVPKPKYSFAPSRQVDKLWHEIIIDTKRYFDLCETVHDGYIHHSPLDPKQASLNAGEIFGYTKYCISKYYGKIVPSIWGKGGACSGPDEPGCDLSCIDD